MKRFLKVTNCYKGLSKAKKEDLIVKVQSTWKLISEEAKFSNTDDILDRDLLAGMQSSSSTSKTTSTTSSQTSLNAVEKKQTLVPKTKYGMTREDFGKWTVAELSRYLSDICINKAGNKEKLVENVYSAYLQKLPITFTDIQQEQQQIENETKAKLVLKNDLITLQNPSSVDGGWTMTPENLLDTVYTDIYNYLKDSNAAKSFKGGKSLLLSGHLKDAKSKCLLLLCSRTMLP